MLHAHLLQALREEEALLAFWYRSMAWLRRQTPGPGFQGVRALLGDLLAGPPAQHQHRILMVSLALFPDTVPSL